MEQLQVRCIVGLSSAVLELLYMEMPGDSYKIVEATKTRLFLLRLLLYRMAVCVYEGARSEDLEKRGEILHHFSAGPVDTAAAIVLFLLT